MNKILSKIILAGLLILFLITCVYGSARILGDINGTTLYVTNGYITNMIVANEFNGTRVNATYINNSVLRGFHGYFDTVWLTYLYSTDITTGTIDTGQGANELYDMDQNVQTTDNIKGNTFNATEYIESNKIVLNNTLNMCIIVNGTDIVISNNVSGVSC